MPEQQDGKPRCAGLENSWVEARLVRRDRQPTTRTNTRSGQPTLQRTNPHDWHRLHWLQVQTDQKATTPAGDEPTGVALYRETVGCPNLTIAGRVPWALAGFRTRVR